MSEIEVDFSENEQKIETNFTDGTRCLNGKSAYEIALLNGFEGTEAEWLESLKGKDGIDGIDGIQGIPGLDGKDGKHAYVFTTAGSSTSFTATIEGYTEYTKGDLFVMIPHVAATTTSPKLNINNLGAYSIQRRAYNSTIKSLRASGCIAKGIPELLVFTGSYFVALSQYQPYGGTDFYTSVSVSKGGTGKTSWTANRLIYASSSSYLSQVYPPNEEAVLTQTSNSSPYWTTKKNLLSGAMQFKGVHDSTTSLPEFANGYVYKFANDITVIPPGATDEISITLDGVTSVYFWESGFDMYGSQSNDLFMELGKLLPEGAINGSINSPILLLFTPNPNEQAPTTYAFYLQAASTYEYAEDNYYYGSCYGSWVNSTFPIEGLYGTASLSVKVPKGTYPAGTYVCTGADWKTLI